MVKREGCLEGGCWHMDYFEPKTFENQQMWERLSVTFPYLPKNRSCPRPQKKKELTCRKPFSPEVLSAKKDGLSSQERRPSWTAHPVRHGHKCKSPICSPKGPFIIHQNHLLSHKWSLSPSLSHSDDP